MSKLELTNELSLDFITALTKIELPPTITATAGWKFDVSAIVAACGVLDLQKAVKIRFTSGGNKPTQSGTARLGSHSIKTDLNKMEYYHSLTISQILYYDEANEFLWHELRHAWQAEAYARVSTKSIGTFYEAYKHANGPHGAGYKLNKFEIDARNFSNRMITEGNMLLIPKAE